MDELQRQHLIDLHQQSLALHGYSPHALYWGSRGIQKARFRVLAEIGILAGDSLLDVGCGFADLDSWLSSQRMPVAYTGIDLSPDLIARAEALHPQAELICGELFDFASPSQYFDWVVLSGTLNWELNDDGNYARRVIAGMFALCRQGVAFNMLNSHHPEMRALHDLTTFDPDEIRAFCKTITPDCHCRSDYLDNDFTIYMRRPA
ncbi:MAG: class I SAM-dependent methyltransferase [Mariprofundaceae bacterium]|nr:class I SAM-dependent methyltransferase [Mariprofundaceae bacterium]